MGIALVFLARIGLSAYKEDLSILAEPLPKSLLIMDKDGELVSELSSSKFTSVPLSDIPDILVDAIVAVEDKRFYKHSGVDIRGIGRSVWRNLVLNILFDQEIINKEDLDRAVNEEIIVSDLGENSLGGEFPSYLDYVIEEAINKYGFDEEVILKGGLEIYTQIDPVVQKSIEAAYERDELFPANNGEELVQSASVVLDPYSGGIRGLVGYRGQHYYGGFNRATQLKRQPGSAIKPLAVYGPALESGYKQSSIIDDKKRDFNGYSPTNINGVYQGRVSLYNALVNSINLPAVTLLDEIGVETGIDFLKKAGIPLHENDRNLSIALGGFTEGVSPLEMAQAFSIFPNLGRMKTAHAIRRIQSSSGEVLLEVEEEERHVMKAENAYTMTQILMGVVKEGSGKNAALDRPTAGKTGTTQLPPTEEFQGLSGSKDAWFVGYSPELVTAVWVGYDRNDPKFVMESSGGNHPARIFNAIMSKALEDVKISSFEVPKGYKEDIKKDKPRKDEKESKEYPRKREKEEKKREKDKKKKDDKNKDKDKKPNKGKKK